MLSTKNRRNLASVKVVDVQHLICIGTRSLVAVHLAALMKTKLEASPIYDGQLEHWVLACLSFTY